LGERTAKALVNQGFTLGQLGRGDEALAVYEQVVRRFGERDELPLAEQTALALVDQAFMLVELGRREEALAVAASAQSRFANRAEPAIQSLLSELDDLVET
jgi:NADP-dependent 3-hydroxy acid dehydrogenase YdfG